MMKTIVPLLEQAENLKIKLEDTKNIYTDFDVCICHQELQDIYHKALLLDLEYALDKKVEQDLWNYIFKNQITILQQRVKEKKNSRSADLLNCLNAFLELASGFYIQLLQEICSTFELNVSFRRRRILFSTNFQPFVPKNCLVQPNHSSCLYICQHCLVHLGDLARYKHQLIQAKGFYSHAAILVPSSGQPYNQLALLEATKGDKLAAVFYYVRSIAVCNPFPVAFANLRKVLEKVTEDNCILYNKDHLTAEEFQKYFLYLQAIFHLSLSKEKVDNLVRILAVNLGPLVALNNIGSVKLIQMVVISLYTLWHFSGNPISTQHCNKNLDESANQVYISTMCIELLATFFNSLLLPLYTLSPDNSVLEYASLPAIKVLLDWIRVDCRVLENDAFTTRPHIWPSLCHLLNELQPYIHINQSDIFTNSVLPEEQELQGFLPLHRVLSAFRLKDGIQPLSHDKISILRANRLISLGKWLAKQSFHEKKILTVHNLNDQLKFEFCCGTEPPLELINNLHTFNLNFEKKEHMTLISTEVVNNYNNDLEENDAQCISGSKKTGILKSTLAQETLQNEKSFVEKNCKPKNLLTSIGTKKIRQNVALQTIMKKTNIQSTSVLGKNRNENRQVTFKTPTPSPPPLQITNIAPSNNHSNSNRCTWQHITKSELISKKNPLVLPQFSNATFYSTHENIKNVHPSLNVCHGIKSDLQNSTSCSTLINDSSSNQDLETQKSIILDNHYTTQNGTYFSQKIPSLWWNEKNEQMNLIKPKSLVDINTTLDLRKKEQFPNGSVDHISQNVPFSLFNRQFQVNQYSADLCNSNFTPTFAETEELWKGQTSTHLQNQHDSVPNTYSLFNSPNLAPQLGNSSWNTTSSNWSHIISNGVQPSFWAGLGPSPLQRLLEQQKQKKDSFPS